MNLPILARDSGAPWRLVYTDKNAHTVRDNAKILLLSALLATIHLFLLFL